MALVSLTLGHNALVIPLLSHLGPWTPVQVFLKFGISLTYVYALRQSFVCRQVLEIAKQVSGLIFIYFFFVFATLSSGLTQATDPRFMASLNLIRRESLIQDVLFVLFNEKISVNLLIQRLVGFALHEVDLAKLGVSCFFAFVGLLLPDFAVGFIVVEHALLSCFLSGSGYLLLILVFLAPILHVPNNSFDKKIVQLNCLKLTLCSHSNHRFVCRICDLSILFKLFYLCSSSIKCVLFEPHGWLSLLFSKDGRRQTRTLLAILVV